ncbi:DASS family sodium-coupled anion symporter [Vibrio gazogenes]|uniref:Divalent anion:Na+ symporter, DASS family n=1 Tax=Vibrio gazogenes DSM 21264 = NBRC 103151 TaxID=1123492 RepID=A0A1M5H1N0_VIBGA|nr:DASS family sodium-coupled anion symporter [Vibrio gazogenes]USP14935.1 anion permease [Vibrio gazogenes]SHG09828.1 divalent anion:Na+ symporter, DASS family [Vibrio gazogenes DSM 21264] [Vibrio gazogenes DSM 21264 = NBRC 103151]SJN53524.1 Inner membrane protein YbhI [Vibrio gazogenes]
MTSTLMSERLVQEPFINKKLLSILLVVIVPLLFYASPAPEGLSVQGWHLFGLFIATILGLIFKPFPAPVILLSVISVIGLTGGNTKLVLSGYSSTTTWIVFSALIMSNAILVTGLGKRIGYILIDKFGKTSLRLGYVLAMLDFIIAPCTPSITARAGGIVFSVAKSISASLNSYPDSGARKIGSYLMMNSFLNTKSTAYVFLTAAAPNLLILPFIKDILGVDLTWTSWFIGAVVPGIVMLLLTPLIIYLVYPPEEKKIDNKRIAKEGLEELGAFSRREKVLGIIFILALAGWVMGSIFHLSAAVVAIAAFMLMLLCGVMSWDEVLQAKGAWTVLVWFGGVIGLSASLKAEGFFSWLGSLMNHLASADTNTTLAFMMIVLCSVLVRYFIVSGSAYVVSMIPVFFTLGLMMGVSPGQLAIALACSAIYGSGITHYSSAAGPIIFSENYVPLKNWWTVGAVVTFINYAINMTLGLWWWNILGL